MPALPRRVEIASDGPPVEHRADSVFAVKISAYLFQGVRVAAVTVQNDKIAAAPPIQAITNALHNSLQQIGANADGTRPVQMPVTIAIREGRQDQNVGLLLYQLKELHWDQRVSSERIVQTVTLNATHAEQRDFVIFEIGLYFRGIHSFQTHHLSSSCLFAT